jgi:hypothetical protein
MGIATTPRRCNMKKPKTLNEFAVFVGDAMDAIMRGEPSYFDDNKMVSVASMHAEKVVAANGSTELVIYSYAMPIVALRENGIAPHGYEINIEQRAQGYSVTTNKHLCVAQRALNRLRKLPVEYRYPQIGSPRCSAITAHNLYEQLEQLCSGDRAYFIKCRRKDYMDNMLHQRIELVDRYIHTLTDLSWVTGGYTLASITPFRHQRERWVQALDYTPKEYAAILTAEQALDYEPNPMGIA